MFLKPCKTFRDPVHGDIQLPQGVITELIDHPDFQRLRRIRQLGVCYLTFHGAEHSRFQHTLGTCWLAFQVMRNWVWKQQLDLDQQEVQATLCAALLHDVGHAPFSHALEHVFTGLNHEAIGWECILTRFNNILERHGVEPKLVVSILSGDTSRPILHQLISSQLDVDRLDYLQRDSLYTGTRYGLFDTQRLLSSLNATYDLDKGREVLALDSKAIEAAEAFLFSRYFMHWQVYFHRAVRSAEFLLRSILEQARTLYPRHLQPPEEMRFLFESSGELTPVFLNHFMACDDTDIITAIKLWQYSPDRVLADLCQRFLRRSLPKVIEDGNHELQQAIRSVVERRFTPVDLYFGVDQPSDLALEEVKYPIRVLSGQGRQWHHLTDVTRTQALRSLSEPVSQSLIFYPPECREEVEQLTSTHLTRKLLATDVNPISAQH